MVREHVVRSFMRLFYDAFSDSTGYRSVNKVGRKARKKRNVKELADDTESYSSAAAT